MCTIGGSSEKKCDTMSCTHYYKSVNNTACGRSIGHVSDASPDTRLVTCMSCRGTSVYRVDRAAARVSRQAAQRIADRARTPTVHLSVGEGNMTACGHMTNQYNASCITRQRRFVSCSACLCSPIPPEGSDIPLVTRSKRSVRV